MILLALHYVVAMEPFGASFALVEVIEDVRAAVQIHEVGSSLGLVPHVEVLALRHRLVLVLRPSSGGSRLASLSRVDLASTARDRHRRGVLARLPIGLLPGSSVVDDVDLIADDNGSVGVGVAIQVGRVCRLDGIGLCNVVVSVVALAPAIMVRGDSGRSIVGLARLAGSKGIRWGVLEGVVVCALTVLSLRLELAEDTLVDTFHQSARAVA